MALTKRHFPTASEALEASLLSKARLSEKKALQEKKELRRQEEARRAAKADLDELRGKAIAKRRESLRQMHLLELLTREALNGENFIDLTSVSPPDLNFLRELGAKIELIFERSKHLATLDRKSKLSMRIAELKQEIANAKEFLATPEPKTREGWRRLWYASGLLAMEIPDRYLSIDPSLAWWDLHRDSGGRDQQGLNTILRFRDWYQSKQSEEHEDRERLEGLKHEKAIQQEKLMLLEADLNVPVYVDGVDQVYRIFFGKASDFAKASDYVTPFHPRWIQWLAESPNGKEFVRFLAEKIEKAVNKGMNSLQFSVFQPSSSRGILFNYKFSSKTVVKGPPVSFLQHLLKANNFKVTIVEGGDGYISSISF